MRRCLGCMKMTDQPVCPHCGYPADAANEPHQLPAGTMLRGQYLVGRVLGQGGFGITYLGWDQDLERLVAIKEFFPSATVNRDVSISQHVKVNTTHMVQGYEASLERFLREARALAMLTDVPEIVGIYGSFRENNTAYIVMEFVKGTELAKMVQKRGGRMGAQETLKILKSVVYALDTVHKAGLVHRDISPDNIILHPTGGAKILDFGAVRAVENPNAEQDLNKSTEAIVKHGFAPMEQYRSRGGIGPWTDEYALCATIYYCLTGRVPPDAVSRSMGEAHPDWQSIPGLTQRQQAALEKGMSVLAKDRFPSVAELATELYAEDSAQAPSPTQAIPQPAPQYIPQAAPQYIPQPAPQPAPQYMPQAAPQYMPQPVPPYAPQPPVMMPPKKKSGATALIVIGVIAALLIALVVCFFTVHLWEDATCNAPKTCKLCGKTEGDQLEHEWMDATCNDPERCKLCGATQGSPVHTWMPATCLEPETCSGCRRTKGSALGHDWIDATFDDPQTCARCGRFGEMALGYIDSVDGEYQTFYWGGMNTHAYHLETTIPGCREFLLFFRITYSGNTQSDQWRLLYQDSNGAWHEHCIFEASPDNWEYIFTFDDRPDIKAVAVIPCQFCEYSFGLAVWNIYSSERQNAQ